MCVSLNWTQEEKGLKANRNEVVGPNKPPSHNDAIDKWRANQAKDGMWRNKDQDISLNKSVSHELQITKPDWTLKSK